MKKDKGTSFIIASGLIILIIFAFVLTKNIVNINESDSYYSKVDEDMIAELNSVGIVDGKLIINTTGNPVAYCAKTTKSRPSVNSMCWNKMDGNQQFVKVLEGKKYYIWIKDNNDNISNYLTAN